LRERRRRTGQWVPEAGVRPLANHEPSAPQGDEGAYDTAPKHGRRESHERTRWKEENGRGGGERHQAIIAPDCAASEPYGAARAGSVARQARQWARGVPRVHPVRLFP